ncbi:MAG TPA: hypothetical protein VJV22_06500 [Acidobacteriaceae bacterium]|nr:hypothetical protein [Acidobacteriaceae bacterium]
MEQLFFHPQVATSELLSRTSEHDVGLALEQGRSLNRAICTTNKLFFYLLGGLAVAATDVPGQLAALEAHKDAASFYTPGDYRALARVLERWRVDRGALERAKAASLACARRECNWERDAKRLVTVVTEALGSLRLQQRAASASSSEMIL